MMSSATLTRWGTVAACPVLGLVILTAQTPSASVATISGKVTAESGPVRAVRVRARDTVHRIAYTVFTNRGGYQIFNLPAGTYEVAAVQDGFESTPRTIDLKPGDARTADLTLRVKPAAEKMALVDYDTLYPPGPGRDVLMKECGGCHGLLHVPLHRFGPRSEEAWRRGVNRMFEVNRSLVPVVSPEAVSAADRELIVKYLNDSFGVHTTRRDLKLDPLVVDEEPLARAIYVEYDLPPVASGPDGKPSGSRGTHDVFPSAVSPMVFMVDTQQSSILGMDLRTLEYPTRFREWKIPVPGNVHPHGIIEAHGKVYWAELSGGAIGELDPATGAISRYLSPSKGGLHTLRADSKGNIWYTGIYGPSRIGRVDAVTKAVTEWDPSRNHPNAHYYGVVVDKRDRVWTTGVTAHIVAKFEPRTQEWTAYPTPTPSAGPRRPTIDSKGRIWFSEHLNDALAMLDPDSGKIVEYKSPLRHSGEYEAYADADDHIWLSLRPYGTLARFDQQTRTYTYFPYPEPGSHTPKIEIDAQGTIWFAAARRLVSLRPNGNVPAPRR